MLAELTADHFSRSSFEGLDKAGCRLDRACGLVTWGLYIPELGLVKSTPVSFNGFHYIVTFALFYTIYAVFFVLVVLPVL